MNVFTEINRKNQAEQFEDMIRDVAVLIVFVLAIFFIYLFINRSKTKRKIREKEIMLRKTSETVMQQEQIMNSLKDQISVPVEDLCQLAMANDPVFYNKFLKAYPNFEKELLSINPNLTQTELNFCAYLMLGFQTKDIANYTFKSVKTIQNRKNSIRKKLSIPSEEDLYFWFKKLETKQTSL